MKFFFGLVFTPNKHQIVYLQIVFTGYILVLLMYCRKLFVKEVLQLETMLMEKDAADVIKICFKFMGARDWLVFSVEAQLRVKNLGVALHTFVLNVSGEVHNTCLLLD